MGDFIHQLAENNVVVFVKHDDCARRQTFQRAVNDFDAVVFQKLVITQSGKRNNIAQAFRAAKRDCAKGRSAETHNTTVFSTSVAS